jgi:hypothetical protein
VRLKRLAKIYSTVNTCPLMDVSPTSKDSTM